jgi:predicted Zn-dependent protease
MVRDIRTIRFVIGLVVVGAGVVSYYMKSQRNPVTGEHQRVSMTPEQEVALGLAAAPQMARRFGGDAPADDPWARLVAEVGARLVASTEASRAPYRFQFHLLNDRATVNAFALPGGQIFITRALLEKLDNEAQLAGVLGHEMGHVIHRHGAEHMAQSELSRTVSTGVGVAAGDRGSAAASQYVAGMVQLKYGREDELESDATGLKYMAEAGYDPRGLLGVMKVLQDAMKGGRTPQMLSSHPYPEQRVEQIEAAIRKAWPGGVPSNLTTGRPIKGAAELPVR